LATNHSILFHPYANLPSLLFLDNPSIVKEQIARELISQNRTVTA
jgi:hypothetical protein